MKSLNEANVALRPAEIVWQLNDKNPSLLRELQKKAPWLSSCYELLLSGCPVAKTYHSFKTDKYFRLKRHWRSFNLVGNSKGTDVLSIKGTEILANDVKEALEKLSTIPLPLGNTPTRHFPNTSLEHFPIIEQSIPMALSQAEALEEANKALEFQMVYFKKHKKLAKIPVPLFVYRWSKEITQQYLSLLQSYLSKRSFELIESQVNAGLSSYVYYYSGVPMRASHLGDTIQGLSSDNGFKTSLETLEKYVDPQKVIEGWLTLLTDILSLGYFPVTLSHYPIGQMVRAQNCVIDGGFVDTASLQKMNEVKNDKQFQETFWTMIADFTDAISRFLIGNRASSFGETNTRANPEITTVIIGCFIFQELQQRLGQKVKSGEPIDKRLQQTISPKTLFGGVDYVMSRLIQKNEPASN